MQQFKLYLTKHHITVLKKPHLLDSYSVESDPNDLEHLNTENTMCLYIPCGSIESARFTISEASMSIRYSIESGLYDQLWDASPPGESTRDYGAFIKSGE